MNEKYELTEEFKEIETLREGWLQKIKVFRIRALRAFAARVEKEHGENIFGKEYKLLIELAKIHFGLQDKRRR